MEGKYAQSIASHLEKFKGAAGHLKGFQRRFKALWDLGDLDVGGGGGSGGFGAAAARCRLVAAAAEARMPSGFGGE